MSEKKINRYSNVELLSQIKTSFNKSKVRIAKLELEKRNLTPEEFNKAELEYEKFKKFQEERKNKPLTNDEWLSFFILPFFTPRHWWRKDHYSQSEHDRYEKYGFEKKARQAKNVQLLGILFWVSIILFSYVIYQYWIK